MEVAAKVQKSEFGGFDVIDTRNGKSLKFGMKGSDAAAYAQYYNEEVAKAEAQWAVFDSASNGEA
jgi:hypothetical protein